MPEGTAATKEDLWPARRSDSLECILQLALLGAGIAKLADFLVADWVRSGQLVRLLADQQIQQSASVFAVIASGTQKIPKVGVFIDFLVERFQPQPWRLDKVERQTCRLLRRGLILVRHPED